MLIFWLLAAGLACIALIFVWLPPILHKRRVNRIDSDDLNMQAYISRKAELENEYTAEHISKEQHQLLLAELERNLLDGVVSPSRQQHSQRASMKGVGSMISAFVLAGTLALYWQLGEIQLVGEMQTQKALAEELSALSPQEQLALIESELAENPSNTDLLYLATRFYSQARQLDKLDQAYEKLLTLTQRSPEILADYAQTLFFVSGNQLLEKARNLAEEALSLQPMNITALGLLGVDAFGREQYKEAISYWETLLKVSPEGESAEAIREAVNQAKERQGDLGVEAPGVSLSVQVALSPNLSAQTEASQTVFVFARAVAGPPMPLAVARFTVADLPANVTLDDSMAMTPAAKLSSFEEVQLVARVSRSGKPIAEPGDFEGTFGPINTSQSQSIINIIIDKVVE